MEGRDALLLLELPVKLTEPEELTDMERVQRKNEYLGKIHGNKESGHE